MLRLRTLLIIVASVALAVMIGAAPLAAQDQVTIKLWHTYNEVGPENDTLVNTLIPMFEAEHPNIHVESAPYPYDDFRQALLTAAAAGEGPDLVRLDIIWSPEFAAQGFLANLERSHARFPNFR